MALDKGVDEEFQNRGLSLQNIKNKTISIGKNTYNTAKNYSTKILASGMLLATLAGCGNNVGPDPKPCEPNCGEEPKSAEIDFSKLNLDFNEAGETSQEIPEDFVTNGTLDDIKITSGQDLVSLKWTEDSIYVEAKNPDATGTYKLQATASNPKGENTTTSETGNVKPMTDILGGALKDNETDTSRPGYIVISDLNGNAIDSVRVGTDGNIPKTQLDQNHNEYLIQAEITKNGERHSYIRRVKAGPGIKGEDFEIGTIKPVPYDGLEEEGVTPERFYNFVNQTNTLSIPNGLKKWPEDPTLVVVPNPTKGQKMTQKEIDATVETLKDQAWKFYGRELDIIVSNDTTHYKLNQNDKIVGVRNKIAIIKGDTDKNAGIAPAIINENGEYTNAGAHIHQFIYDTDDRSNLSDILGEEIAQTLGAPIETPKRFGDFSTLPEVPSKGGLTPTDFKLGQIPSEQNYKAGESIDNIMAQEYL